VTGTDANGNSSQAVATLLHDSPARITVDQPIDSSVVAGTSQLDASCVDDDPAGGCTLSVSVEDGPMLVGPSPSPLHASISLDQYDGKLVALLVTAKDSKDQSSVVRRMVWVETSSHLQAIGTVEGNLLAVSGTRLLWSTGSTVGIRQGGTSEIITTTVEGTPQVGLSFLTPVGALFATAVNVAPYSKLYLWSNGSLTTKALTALTTLAASGNYVIYNLPPGLNGTLYRTDVTSGTEIKIDTTASNANNSVAENGDVAFWTTAGEIVRYRNGAETNVTSDGGSIKDFYPLTDGINIVFRRSPPTNPDQFEIWLYDGSTLSMLAPSRNGNAQSVTDYVVNGGWTAFTKDDGSGGFQVWTRSPTGTLQAVAGSGPSPKIRALGPDGSVIFDSNVDRYYAAPGGTPTRVSSFHGTVVWDSGHFVMLLGSTALTINP